MGNQPVTEGVKYLGLEFKQKLSAILAVIHGTSIALTYIITQGDLAATILWFAVSTGVTAGLSYYKDQEQPENQTQHSTPETER